MSTQFIKSSDKLASTLNTKETIVVEEFGTWVQGRTIEDLQYSQLNALYSIPTGLARSAISDISGVYLIDYSGVVVAEQVGFTCTQDRELLTILDNLLCGLPDKTFDVIIESNRNNNKTRHEVEVTATHILAAVSTALDDVISLVYGEAYDEGEVENAVKRCVTNNKSVVVSYENGNTYKILSVSEAAISD